MQRYTNLAIAGLLLGAVATGLMAQATGTMWSRAPVVLHGIAAFSLVILTPWKSLIAGRGLQRRRAGRLWSLALAMATVVTVASGLVQMSGTISKFGPLTTMQLHVGGAVVTVGLAIVHYVQHPVRPRPADLNRRTFLRASLLGIGGAAAWIAWEGVVRVLGWPGAERRFTGSHERGSGDPEAMPTTQWLNDTAPQIDRADWRVVVGSHVIRPSDVDALPLETLDATLDCTSGWYSTQAWRGIRLDRLLDTAGAASIDVRSVTG